eukprot:gene7166-biopygen4397
MGPKVEHLPVPLFPWQDAKLKELNAKILDLADTCEGGSLAEDDELRKLFAPEDKVLLAHSSPVVVSSTFWIHKETKPVMLSTRRTLRRPSTVSKKRCNVEM